MISRKYRFQKKRKSYRIVNLFVVATLILTVFLEIAVRPIVLTAIRYQGKIFMAEILAKETANILQEFDFTYQDMVAETKDSSGKITSISANVYAVNQIKNAFAVKMTEALGEIKQHTYHIPLGSLLGNSFISGRGPAISFKVMPMGYVDIQVVSHFEEAGINQTSHQILLTIKLDFTASVPLHQSAATMETSFILAQTIIVGEVPQYYASVSDKNNKLPSYENGMYLNRLHSIKEQ